MDNEDIRDTIRIEPNKLDFRFIVFEHIRETMKLFREDYVNNLNHQNKLNGALNGLDALTHIMDKDDEAKSKEALEDPKEYFKTMMQRISKSPLMPKTTTDLI